MREDLPLHSTVWKLCRNKIRQRIIDSEAEGDLNDLVKAGCAEDSLLYRLAAIADCHDRRLRPKAAGITQYRIRTASGKLHEAADLLDRLERAFAPLKMESLNNQQLVDSLRRKARELEKLLPALVRRNRLSLENASLCSLIGYVDRMTGRHHDREVSSLIGAVLGKGSYVATHLAQWRSKYQTEIDLLGNGVVTPSSLLAPRS
jgi:hypothetical protein